MGGRTHRTRREHHLIVIKIMKYCAAHKHFDTVPPVFLLDNSWSYLRMAQPSFQGRTESPSFPELLTGAVHLPPEEGDDYNAEKV